jgi:hypothetical protein
LGYLNYQTRFISCIIRIHAAKHPVSHPLSIEYRPKVRFPAQFSLLLRTGNFMNDIWVCRVGKVLGSSVDADGRRRQSGAAKMVPV